MYLSKLTLDNFLPYESATMTLPATGLMFIAGANNSGKSALLAAFDVAAGRADSRAWRFAGAADPAQIVATYTLSEDERQSLVDLAQQQEFKPAWMASEAFTKARITFMETGAFMSATEVALTGQDGGMRPIAQRTFGSINTFTESKVNVVALLGQQPAGAEWQLQETASGSSSSHNGGDNSLITSAYIGELWSQWASPLYHFSGIRTGTEYASQVVGVGQGLQPTGANLAVCLLHLFSQSAPEWDEIQRVISQVLPDVGRLVAPVAGNQVEAAFIDPASGSRRNIKNLGAGVEQVLMTTYVGATQPPGSVILIEEPETNLHAAAERELLRHLTEWAKVRVIVLSTHSTVFLDQAAATSSATWLVERKNGKSTIRNADTDFSSVLRAVGVRLSDMLSAEKLILVEGATDAEILQNWFPELLLTRRTAVVPLGGGDRAYQVEMIEGVFDAADRLGREVLFLRDRDNLSARNLEKLQRLSKVELLAQRELENYLLDPDAIVTLLKERGDGAVKTPTRSDINALIEATAATLKDVVVLKSVADELVPIRIVDRATIREIAAQGGGLTELRKAVVEALPSADTQLAALDAAWERVNKDVSANWAKRKLEVAPGSEILDAVWREYGGRYDKRRDGPRIAAVMEEKPDEIKKMLADFLPAESNDGS